jgi:hypothetical protein
MKQILGRVALREDCCCLNFETSVRHKLRRPCAECAIAHGGRDDSNYCIFFLRAAAASTTLSTSSRHAKISAARIG